MPQPPIGRLQAYTLYITKHCMEEAKVYIQFEDPTPGEEKELTKLQKTIVNLLSKIIPKGNPDFDEKIGKVKTWFLEYNVEDNYANREIGFDKDFKIILRMPFKDNYGYWTDNHLTMEDYLKFNPKEITKQQFEEKWQTLEKTFGNT